ncbi:hypothetical protein [Brevibacterium gallinarum]|uniref:Uncharacterized protein n=1 Tax=Brevibacterium gallinarum TaxID=2762220 RepID=A0ABR8WR44_9MICO|nr:hypothetical protein [Brevibacterium gallinarum]MBD8019363.1 hypothetical protein [Brevibacterium gallinarum]
MGEFIVTLVLAAIWFAAGFANGRLSERKRHARDLAELEMLANLAASASDAGALIAARKGVELEYVVPDEIEVGDRLSFWDRETGQVIEYEAGFNGDTGQQDEREGEWFRHVEC